MNIEVKNITLITFILIAFNSYGQSKKDLDTKYGILNFKLGMNIEDLESRLSFVSNGRVGEKFYDYQLYGNETILNNKIKSIGLIFYKNMLYLVHIELSDEPKVYDDLLLDKLENMFGKAEKEYNKQLGPLDYKWVYYWITDKVQLCFDKQIIDAQNEIMAIWVKSNLISDRIEKDNF